MDYVPNTGPLVDAFFESDDDNESQLIFDIIQSFENGSSWPRRLYDSVELDGDLNLKALEAVRLVCKDYYDHQYELRQQRRRALQFPNPDPAPSFTVHGEPSSKKPLVKTDPEANPPPSEPNPPASKTHKNPSPEVPQTPHDAKPPREVRRGKKRGRKPKKVKTKGQKKGKKPKIVLENPPPIVCALSTSFEWPTYWGASKGMGKRIGARNMEVGECSRVPVKVEVDTMAYDVVIAYVSGGAGADVHRVGVGGGVESPEIPQDAGYVEVVRTFVISDSDNLSDKSYDLYISDSGDDYNWSVVRVARKYVPRVVIIDSDSD